MVPCCTFFVTLSLLYLFMTELEFMQKKNKDQKKLYNIVDNIKLK